VTSWPGTETSMFRRNLLPPSCERRRWRQESKTKSSSECVKNFSRQSRIEMGKLGDTRLHRKIIIWTKLSILKAYDIKMWSKLRLIRDRNHRQARINMVINLWIPRNKGRFEWLQVSAASQMRSSLFRDVTQCWLLVTFTDVSSYYWTPCPLTMGPIGCSETSVTKWQTTLRHILEERRSQGKFWPAERL